MQLRAEQLRNDLKARQWPVYLICGDEPLQRREAVDMIRKAARYYGFTDRQVFSVEAGFDWQELEYAAQEMSLFSSRRLLELHLPGAKPGDNGAKALIQYAESIPEDTILLIISAKIEASTKKSKWYKTLDKIGAIVQVWPLADNQLKGWLQNRLQSRGLRLQPDAVELICDRVEGNLLAADQEIEKLALLYPDAHQLLTREQVAEAVLDSARYNVFNLFDTALSGDLQHASRMLTGLMQESTALLLIVSLIAKEVRLLAKLSVVTRQEGMDRALKGQYIFPARKAIILQALKQRKAEEWESMLLRLLEIDKVAKGIEAGSPWEQLQLLLADIAGKSYLRID